MELAIFHRNGDIIGVIQMDSWRYHFPFDRSKADDRGIRIDNWEVQPGETVAASLEEWRKITDIIAAAAQK